MRPTAQTKLFFTVIGNLSLLFLISLLCFSKNPGLLLAGNDGPNVIFLAQTQRMFYGISPHLHSNLFEGLGNISFPFNLAILPGFWHILSGHLGSFAQGMIYSWFALQLFVSVLLIGWNYGFQTKTNYIAAWLLTILAFPYFESVRIYAISANCPAFLSIITLFAIMDTGIKNAGKSSWLASFGYGALLLSGISMGLTVCPAIFILLLPTLSLTTLHAIITISSREEMIKKIITGLLVLSIVIALHWPDYILGLLLDTAAVIFKSDMKPVDASLVFASILFHGSYKNIALGPWLFIGSILGITYTIKKINSLRSIAITILIGQLLMATTGYVLMSIPNLYDGPSPIYFELPLLPFYALFSSLLITDILLKHLNRKTALSITILLLLSLLFSQNHQRQDSDYRLIPTSNAITSILENEIAIYPPQAFNGRVANIIPGKDWIEQFNYFYTLNRNSGNDLQTTGLWLKNIPTLHEYNQIITPAFYSIYRHFLSNGKDIPYRSWSNFNVANIKILRLLGVRFILSTAPFINGAKLRATLAFKENLETLHLFQISNPNTSGVSASRIISTHSIVEAENAMDKADFTLNTAVILSADNIATSKLLSPAKNSQIIFEQGGLHIKAVSEGMSLLILPIEYSSCINTKVISGSTPSLTRVDIALTGILFEKELNVILDNRISPFANPRCRLMDYHEFKKFKV
jgi:hypothetical protein